MKTFRLLLSLFLCLQLSLPANGQNLADNPTDLTGLVDDYVARMKSKYSPHLFLPVGRDEYLSKAVAARIAAQDTGNFNRSVLYLIGRYIEQVEERPYLFTLIQMVRARIAPDLEATRLLQEGPHESVVQRIYSSWVWVWIAAGVGWRFLLIRSALLSARTQEIHAALARRGRLYHIPYRLVANPATISAEATAGWGYLEYLTESAKAHKVDPVEILKVAQANLACHLSYRGLEIEDRIEALKDQPGELKRESPTLREAAAQVLKETQVMDAQNKFLQNLRVNDRFFGRALSHLPPSKDWQSFRSALNSTDEDQPGTCRQISLHYLKHKLQERMEDLAPEEKPEDTAPAAQENPT
jgi:hypothetical protein